VIRDEDLFLSAVTLGEIAKGVFLLRDSPKKKVLNAWLSKLENQFADRILPVEHQTARLWGEISGRCQANGTVLTAIEGLLAATALRHGLHIMTRSTRGLEATGALILDPWQALKEVLTPNKDPG
jgi:predicted nucleic acid-binding protein